MKWMRVVTVMVYLGMLVGSEAWAQANEGATNFGSGAGNQTVQVWNWGGGFGLRGFTNSGNPVGAVYGRATATGGFTNGVWGETDSTAGVGVRGHAFAQHGAATGGAFFSWSDSGTGMYARANSRTGFTAGVHGLADSNQGAGVIGEACTNTSNDCLGGAVAVFGITHGINGTAARFQIQNSGCPGCGTLIVGQFGDSNVFRVGGAGDVHASSYNTGGADFAEAVTASGIRDQYKPGDVLVIDPHSDRQVTKSSAEYSTLVAGIYSTKPGVVASPRAMGEVTTTDVPLAVVGIVPCKVTAANGAIQRGDLLVTSSVPGYAMKGTDRLRMTGAIVGKALEPLAAGEGRIQILVTLQ